MSFGKSLRLGLAFGLVLAIGCGDDGETTTDSGIDAGIDAGDVDAGDEDAGDVDADVDAGDEDAGPVAHPCTAPLQAAIAAVELTGYSADDATEMAPLTDGTTLDSNGYDGHYRDDLATHPGCAPRTEYGANSEVFVTTNEATVPAGTVYAADDYDCGAKVYTQDSADTTKPIVILVHGNSSGVNSFEEFAVASLAGTTVTTLTGFTFVVEEEPVDSLATALLADGFEVVSFDARTDTTLAFEGEDNTAANIDHGWAVPMLESLIKSVIANNEGREISLVGHSLGVTVIRDALRRLWNERDEEGGINPFAYVHDVVLLSGANHGVSSGALCEGNDTMRGTVACEMGDLATGEETYFNRGLNGPSDVWSVPCADGLYAYGVDDACGGNAVEYTTVTMRDLEGGALQDEFVSEESSRLNAPEECVDNELIELTDYDASGFFFGGLFASHFGSARAAAGVTLVLEKLND